jgi:hypothetical protein
VPDLKNEAANKKKKKLWKNKHAQYKITFFFALIPNVFFDSLKICKSNQKFTIPHKIVHLHCKKPSNSNNTNVAGLFNFKIHNNVHPATQKSQFVLLMAMALKKKTQ